MSSKRVDQEKTHKQHAQLITEVPMARGWLQPDVFLYQGYWLYSEVVLGAMLMQKHFKHRDSDIFLSSFMKSGTTWLKALMVSILNRSRFDFSNHPLLRQGPHDYVPHLEFYISKDYWFANLDHMPSPRFFASHFAHSLFPSSITDPSSGCKFVYVCRDPKDVLVSMWHFMQPIRSKELPPILFNEAFESFCDGILEYGPYWDHVLGFWRASIESPDKILFVKYEEIMRDPKMHVKKLAEFMGVPISFEEEENGVVEKIVEFCSFRNMKNLEINKTGVLRNEDIVIENQFFFRRGEVGDWESHLKKEMRDRIDHITNHKFKGSGLIVDARGVQNRAFVQIGSGLKTDGE